MNFNKQLNNYNEIKTFNNYLSKNNQLEHFDNSGELENNENQLNNLINSTKEQITKQYGAIEEKKKEIEEKDLRNTAQDNEIEQKQDLLTTRDRMLQVIQDKNIYKKKIIYTLLSLIFAVLIVLLISYVMFLKKKK